MSTSVERKENEILYEALIKLKKSGPDGYPLITVVDTRDMSGNDITIFRSNITGVQLQEYKRDAHNQAHMDKIRCTLLKHIYKLYEKRDKKNKTYLGKSVFSAVNLVNTKISKKLKGQNIHNQERIDTLLINLDGTRQKTLFPKYLLFFLSLFS